MKDHLKQFSFKKVFSLSAIKSQIGAYAVEFALVMGVVILLVAGVSTAMKDDLAELNVEILDCFASLFMGGACDRTSSPGGSTAGGGAANTGTQRGNGSVNGEGIAVNSSECTAGICPFSSGIPSGSADDVSKREDVRPIAVLDLPDFSPKNCEDGGCGDLGGVCLANPPLASSSSSIQAAQTISPINLISGNKFKHQIDLSLIHI